MIIRFSTLVLDELLGREVLFVATSRSPRKKFIFRNQEGVEIYKITWRNFSSRKMKTRKSGLVILLSGNLINIWVSSSWFFCLIKSLFHSWVARQGPKKLSLGTQKETAKRRKIARKEKCFNGKNMRICNIGGNLKWFVAEKQTWREEKREVIFENRNNQTRHTKMFLSWLHATHNRSPTIWP